MEINEALITEVVVIIQEQKEKTGKMEDRRTLQKEMTTYHAVTFVNLFLIGLLIAQKKRNEAEISLLSNDIQECCMAEFVTLFRIGLFAAAHK